MNENDELFNQEAVKQPQSPTPEELAQLKDREKEEERLWELQLQQRRDSIEALGYDVQESSCPKCHARNSMIIVDKGKKPRFLGLCSLLVPRLKNCGSTLHCFSCGRDVRMPGLFEELLMPALVMLFIVLLVVSDLWLMKYLCNYGK